MKPTKTPLLNFKQATDNFAANHPRWTCAILCLILGLISLATYSNSFQGGMVLDNAIVLQMDPRLQPPVERQNVPNPSPTAKPGEAFQIPYALDGQNFLQWPKALGKESAGKYGPWATMVKDPYRPQIARMFSENYWWPSFPTDLYRPLTTLSYFFNYTVLGSKTDLFSYHVVNWLLHWFNACLALLICRALWPNRFGISFLAAAIFALHPVAVESVTNIVGRADLLSTLTIFLGAYIYIRMAAVIDTPVSGGKAVFKKNLKWLLLMLSFAGVACVGVLTKESAVMLAGFVLLYDYFFRWLKLEGSWSQRTSTAIRKYVILGWVWLVPALTLVLWGKYVILQASPFYGQIFIDNPIVGANWFDGHMTAIKVLGLYLGLLVFPSTLSCDYSFNQIPVFGDHTARFWDNLQAWVALVVIVLLLLAAWRWRKRNPAFGFGVCFFFLMILPTSNLVITIGSIMAERFLYLPLLGFAIVAAIFLQAAAMGIGRFWERETGRPASWAFWLPLVVLAAFGIRSYVRNFDWRDDISLWRSAVEACPRSFKVHKGYAGSLRIESQPYFPAPTTLDQIDGLEAAYLNSARKQKGAALLMPGASLTPEESARVARWRNQPQKNGQGIPDETELYFINTERAKHGRKPYAEDPTLDENDKKVRDLWASVIAERGLDKALARVEEGIRVLDSGNLPDSKQDNTLFYDSGLYYNTKAKVLEERGDVQEALRYYQRAYEILWRGVRVDMHVNKASKEAMRARGIKEENIIDVGNPKIRTQFIVAALRLGRTQEAYESAEVNRRMVPMDAEADYILGVVLREKGKADESRMLLVEALLINGDYPQAWKELADAYAKIPGAKNAIVEGPNGGPALNSDNPIVQKDLKSAFTDLENLLWETKRYDEAKTIRQIATKNFKQDPSIFPLRDSTLRTGSVARSGRAIGQEGDE